MQNVAEKPSVALEFTPESSDSEEEETVPLESESKRLRPLEEVKRTPKVRKFDSSYIKFGFVKNGDDRKPTALCVVCQEVLGNGCSNPSKLQRHLRKKHPKLQSRSQSFFQLAANDLRQSQGKLIAIDSRERIISAPCA